MHAQKYMFECKIRLICFDIFIASSSTHTHTHTYIYIYIIVYNTRETVQGLDFVCRNLSLIGISVEHSMTTAIGCIINFRFKIYRKSHA